MQARQSLDETRWLLDCAQQSKKIAGVVGWLPLFDLDALSASFEELKQKPRFVGVREILQDKPEGFLLVSGLDEGMRHLTLQDLSFDLLVRSSQLDEAARFVDRHPNQRFVLDHAAKPHIARREMEPWASSIRKLAHRPSVFCKLSGLVTEADWQRWTEAEIQPYLDVCLQAFGPERCMAGTDWPVCLTAVQYEAWWELLERWSQDLSATERRSIMGGTAALFYKLPEFANGVSR